MPICCPPLNQHKNRHYLNMEPYYPPDNVQFQGFAMTSRGYGLPVSVVLFGTIYAIALAVAPTSSSAAQQPAWPHDEQQIADSHWPCAHTAHGISIILDPHPRLEK